MGTIDEVKAGVGAFTDGMTSHVTALRAIADAVEREATMLRAVTAGTSHAKVAEALARVAQIKQKVDEAAQITLGAIDAGRAYATSL